MIKIKYEYFGNTKFYTQKPVFVEYYNDTLVLKTTNYTDLTWKTSLGKEYKMYSIELYKIIYKVMNDSILIKELKDTTFKLLANCNSNEKMRTYGYLHQLGFMGGYIQKQGEQTIFIGNRRYDCYLFHIYRKDFGQIDNSYILIDKITKLPLLYNRLNYDIKQPDRLRSILILGAKRVKFKKPIPEGVYEKNKRDLHQYEIQARHGMEYMYLDKKAAYRGKSGRIIWKDE